MRRRSGEQGQVAVEAAMTLPLLVLLVLGGLQLATMQRARILTEYAAYNAARAGIVWSGNAERMLEAATLSILPAFGPTDSLTRLAETRARFAAGDAIFRALPLPGPARSPRALPESRMRGMVRVETLSPAPESADWEELDFDAVPAKNKSDGTILEVRVRYFHELRIPLANDVIFRAWRNLRLWDEGETVTGDELLALSGLAETGRYFIPITTTCAMRMQSNFHRKWLMTEGGE